MRYSEAIRLGGMMAPKGLGKFINEQGAVCVQGAALQAMGIQLKLGDDVIHNRQILTLWPYLKTKIDTKDIPNEISFFGNSASSLRFLSYVLNDLTYWTREQIADWVAQMEVKYDLIKEEICEPIGKMNETVLTIG